VLWRKEKEKDMGNAIVAVYLGIGAWMDVKTKKLSVEYLVLGVLLGLGFWIREICLSGIAPLDSLMRVLPGLIFLGYGKVTREKIGYGDGMILLILSAFFGYSRLWAVWIIGILLTALWGGLLWMRKKATRNTALAYLPFLFISHLLLWGMSYG
jgi:leader peptidase (prepilin peptidase)/N-methyltransferase